MGPDFSVPDGSVVNLKNGCQFTHRARAKDFGGAINIVGP